MSVVSSVGWCSVGGSIGRLAGGVAFGSMFGAGVACWGRLIWDICVVIVDADAVGCGSSRKGTKLSVGRDMLSPCGVVRVGVWWYGSHVNPYPCSAQCLPTLNTSGVY